MNEQFTDALLVRTVWLQRVASGLNEEVDAALDGLRRLIVAELAGGVANPVEAVQFLIASELRALRGKLEAALLIGNCFLRGRLY